MNKLIEIKETPKKIYLTFDNETIKILPDTFKKINLIIGNNYDINFILLEDKITLIYKESIKKLSKKISSEYNFRKYLEEKRVLDSKSINRIINSLKETHYIDDYLYSNMLKHALNKDYYGKYYIINELRHNGIGNNIIAELDFNYDSEYKKACTYFKLISNKYASNNYAKQKRKIYNELLKHGFDVDIILKIVRSIPLVKDKEIEKMHKDFCKIKQRLGIDGDLKESNKGKIISELIKKGYSYSDINELVEEECKND